MAIYGPGWLSVDFLRKEGCSLQQSGGGHQDCSVLRPIPTTLPKLAAGQNGFKIFFEIGAEWIRE